MIPIRDTTDTGNFPLVNYLIIAANVLLYLVQLAQGPEFQRLIITYGLIPARYSVPQIAAHFTLGQQILSFFSYMFLHGGFWHLLGNMWSLYIFGDNVEGRLGSLRYLAFYLLCGVASALSHMALNWESQVPTIGASGAIAGVMGAYLLLFPKARVLTLIPILIIPYFVELPAFIFLGIWFILQFLSAAGSPAGGGGVAWWAHIGGFLFGMLCLQIFRLLPQTGITARVRRRTTRKKTPRLQALRTSGSGQDANLHGTISLTAQEAQAGSRKLVNIPWGFKQRLMRVAVPPGVKDGTTLRLAGLGRRGSGDEAGDLFLRVEIRP